MPGTECCVLSRSSCQELPQKACKRVNLRLSFVTHVCVLLQNVGSLVTTVFEMYVCV